MKIYSWQTEIWQKLISAYQQQRLPHALLFLGAKGVGKREFAKTFANFLLCKNKVMTSVPQGPCGHCRECHLFQSQTHPDFFPIFLQEESKVLKIEQIREIQYQLSQTAHSETGYQVVLLYPANQLNAAAANAFLKTLEEPTGKVVIVLISDQIGKLPATILSRCQIVNFKSVNSELALNQIEEMLFGKSTNQMEECREVDIKLHLAFADNAPLYAKYLLDNHYLTIRNQLMNLLIEILNGQLTLSNLEQFLKEDLQLFFYALNTIVLDLMRLHFSVNESALFNYDQAITLKKLTAKLNKNTLAKFSTTVIQAYLLWVRQANLNWQLCLENIFLEWEECFHVD